ncbi:hypothetical protein TeGR_g9039 [Tetraparma gracilis]|uniref:Ribosomal protein L22 n=1 Tax=Tetraparma gracilis TaxID=2962635 RepID=A0ABQ6MG90_9STRA|nr:hypothetical protein TeGR_g9039 [Tetraparma gracilis]
MSAASLRLGPLLALRGALQPPLRAACPSLSSLSSLAVATRPSLASPLLSLGRRPAAVHGPASILPSFARLFSTASSTASSSASPAAAPPAPPPPPSSAPPPPPPEPVRYGKIVKERHNPRPRPPPRERFDHKLTWGTQKGIRVSPWKLNLLATQIRGLRVPDALLQLRFSKKGKAPLLRSLVFKTANLADIRHSLHPAQLEVAQCFVTPGTPLKRLTTMARGRAGARLHRHAHVNVVLGRIDFEGKIEKAESKGQKKKW